MNNSIFKFIAFTDLHYTTKNPEKRIDNYSESLFLKLNEIYELAIKYEINGILFAGDLFHRKGDIVTHEEVNDVIKIFSKWNSSNINIYLIAGNHDLVGHNLNAINDNGIGTLIISGHVKLLNKEPIRFEFNNGKKLNLFGSSYSRNYDRNKENYIVDDKYKEDFNINLVHGILLPKGTFFGDYTLINEIVKNAANITICGHYHPGFEQVIMNNKYFLNPGSISRGVLNYDTTKRTPKILLIGVDKSYNVKIKEVELKTAKLCDEIFDIEFVNKQNKYDEEIKSFTEMIKNETQSMDNNDVNIILDDMLKNNIIERNIYDKSIEILEKVGVFK
jgi:DNA repair exonuclease SbcCD nuclease subunit